MTDPRQHDEFDRLAVGWALHALEPEDEDVFARHLPGCDRCARTVAESVQTMAALAAELPEVEPAPDLGALLRAAVAGAEQVPVPELPTATGFPGYRPPPPSQPQPRRGNRVVASSLAAVVVAALLGFGAWAVSLAGSRADLEATVAAQQEIVDALLEPGRATVTRLDDGERRVATVVARDDRLAVVTHALPQNDPRSSVYVVWGVGDGAPTALGTFDVARSQTSLQTVGSGQTGLDDYPGYGISLEPGRSAPSAPTEVVATGEVDR